MLIPVVLTSIPQNSSQNWGGYVLRYPFNFRRIDISTDDLCIGFPGTILGKLLPLYSIR